ncbi:MAG: single-stranded DNA-binding protein, partial [Lutibacter sp.]
MSNTFNRVEAIGRVGKDPEIRFSAEGNPITTFSIATDNVYTKDGEKKVDTEWINLVSFGKAAEFYNKYLHKSSLIYIEGRLKTRSWQSQDGQLHSRTEVIPSRILFLDPRNSNYNGKENGVNEEPC